MFNMWPYKTFLTSKFSYLFILQPHHKTKITNRWETTNSKPPKPIIVIG
jgi:hypothetical protein